MNLGGKDLDALLSSWPASLPKGMTAGSEEERGWDDRADVIVRAAQAARDDVAKAEALFEAPSLSPEPGEDAAVRAAGEKKMSQEKESGDPPVSMKGEGPASTAAPERKRTSLKEIAARASQSGARLSQPGAPPPSSMGREAPSSAVPSARPSGRASTPPPSSRPVEAGKDDSGVINLKVVHASATAQQVAAAAKAKPAQAGLFEDEKTTESAADPAPQQATAKKPAEVAVLQPKKSNAGVIGGIAIAVLGIAAAFAIVSRKPPTPTPTAPVADKPAATQAAVAEKPAAPVQTTTPAPTPDSLPSASAEPDGKVAEAPKGAAPGPMPTGATTAAASGTAGALAKVVTPSGKPGDLQSEMAKAVGKDAAAKADAPAATPEPAAGGPRNQNIPEQPSQGAVAAAFGPVMGGAKACVAGADDVSRASVTFASSGSVTSVSVSGWAAAHGKSGCVQAALKAAKVGPFSKSSFTVGVPIRP